MFVKFKQFVVQKLHPLMNSDLSKTKIQAGDMPKIKSGQKHNFLWHSMVERYLCWKVHTIQEFHL